MPGAAGRLDPEIYIPEPCLPEASEGMKLRQFPLHPASIVPLIKRGHQRRLVCWRQTQSVLIAIRREVKDIYPPDLECPDACIDLRCF